jgi:hypothetical protein
LSEVSVKFKLGEYFRPGSHKIAISVPELVQQTNEFSTKNRPGCNPKLTGSNPRSLFLNYNVKCNLKTSDPAGHDVKVRFDLSSVTDETSAKNLDVEASCTCAAFLYWGAQWNLNQRDALEGEPRPLLTAPTERLDLRNHFLICKHCKAVFERILPSVQHNIVNIIRQRNVQEHKKRQKEKGIPGAPDKLLRRKKKEETPPSPVSGPHPPSDHVVKRDEPATPEERAKTPVLDEDKVDVPTPVAPAPLAPMPMIKDLDEKKKPETVSRTAPAAAPPQPTPNNVPATATPGQVRDNSAPAAALPPQLKPQKTLPRLNPRDNERLKQLQKQDQIRRHRETQQRLRNNPGRR